MSELSEDPAKVAGARGLDVVLPAGNELFIDIDDAESLKHYAEMREVMNSNGYHVQEIKRTTSAGGNQHIYVRVPRLLSPLQRIALQACLGSDRKRELLSFLRVDAGVAFPPTCFFEKPALRSEHEPLAAGVDSEVTF